MAKLNASEIASFAQSAGMMNNVQIATAIALAESGGDTTAHNAIPPDNSYGLWQINMLGPLGPQRRKMLGISKNEDLYNPNINAKAMVKLSNGGKNFVPWTTYTSGKYKLFMNEANGGAGTPGGSDVPDQGGALSNLADKISDSHFWARIGYYVLGFLLILIGFVLIVGMGKAKQITNIAKKVTA